MNEFWEIIKEHPKLTILIIVLFILMMGVITDGAIDEDKAQKEEQQWEIMIEQRLENLEKSHR